MNQIQQYNFVKEQGVPCSFILEYNKEVQADNLFAVVRVQASDTDYIARFDIAKIENLSDDAVTTFKLTLDGDIPQGRYVYDVFVYSGDKPKVKILAGHILVKASISDRGRDRGNTGV